VTKFKALELVVPNGRLCYRLRTMKLQGWI